MKQKVWGIVSILSIFIFLMAACAAPAAAPSGGEATYTTVVKIAGINWFNRMEEGVKKFGEESGISASLVGPAEADAAQQIPIIEDLIAQGVDALCVIPMDPVHHYPRSI